jgi:fumarate reductase subunit C
MNVRLYILQRASAALMLPLIVVHLAVIFYATRHQLTAADILARTRSSPAWGLFYGTFVVAAALHAAIGVRNVVAEWSALSNRAAGLVGVVFGVLLLALGFRAVAAVVLP